MIRLTPQRRMHVPHKLAVLAAVTLALTSLIGISGRDTNNQQITAGAAPEASQQAVTDDTTARRGKLNISKLLFGYG